MIRAVISPKVRIGCNCVRQQFVAGCSYVANRKKSLRRVVMMGLEAELSATSGGIISLANGSEGAGLRQNNKNRSHTLILRVELLLKEIISSFKNG